jgi:hypothetical protein
MKLLTARSPTAARTSEIFSEKDGSTVTPDGQRMLGVGRLLSSHDGLHPSKYRAEKQIICRFLIYCACACFTDRECLAYNLERKEIDEWADALPFASNDC